MLIKYTGKYVNIYFNMKNNIVVVVVVVVVIFNFFSKTTQ